ncbi:Fe-S cluster assembly protein SufD [Oricola sp.]|uniref:Fe-S cluster assembly protein SufD n=1 Tax=Oricola sp. TaxID=1979950 RepID=UPI0025EDFB32|nr:Fe-S cluster assembly protein SufD [Oricola sp.]MCI5073932.1 Fe-S cluster assembly protein SufD [Oricola sp.]
MTVQSKLPLTAAETALVDQFGTRVGSLPGNANVVQIRDRAIQAIKENGLPTRRVEAWHYTDLRRLLAGVPADDPAADAADLEPVLSDAVRFTLKNGRIAATGRVESVTVQSMADALRADVSGVSLADHGIIDATGLINAAFVTDGFVVQVEDGAEPAHPVELQSLHDGGQAHVRNVVTVGEGSRATFFDRQAGSDAAVLDTAVTELKLRKNAEATWITVQETGEAATHLAQMNITLDENAKLTLFVVNLSGKIVRQEINADVLGEGADLTFRAVNLIGDDAHCDITLSLGHLVPNTTSTETVRNVVTGRAQGVFQGQIRVDQIAQKTDAQMACNTLLLSDDAGFSTKPELEIFADDVVCAHGATVAEIDHNHLFYLMARGISEKTARGLLIKAFVAEIVEELADERLIEALETRIDRWLEAHG